MVSTISGGLIVNLHVWCCKSQWEVSFRFQMPKWVKLLVVVVFSACGCHIDKLVGSRIVVVI